MAFDVSFRDTFTSSAKDLSRFSKSFLVNEGVATDGLRVTQSDTPAMSVKVAVGTGYFYGSGSNAEVMYEFNSDAEETVAIGASGVQARIDIVCLKVDASTQVASIVAIAGTPSGSPAVPATPSSHYKLAEVAVGISVTTITNTNITDTRRNAFVIAGGARGTGLINGVINPTVAGNNLTLAVKTLSGADPSITNPVGIWIGDRLRFITSALSATANAGTNWFGSGASELATQSIDYFAYIGQLTSGGGLELGFARLPSFRLGSEASTTTTNEKYIRFSTGTSPANFTEMVNIGRFAATLSAGAGHNWSVPTYTAITLIQEPIFESRILSYLPTYGGSGSLTYTSVTTTTAKYQVMRSRMFATLDATGTSGGTTNHSLTATLPFAVIGEQSLGTTIRDATSGQTVSGVCGAFGNQLFFRKFDASNWTLSTARITRGTGIVEI